MPSSISSTDPSMYEDFDARSPSQTTLSSGFRSPITLHNDDSSMTSQESSEAIVPRRRATVMSVFDARNDFAAGDSRYYLTEHVKHVELQRDMLRQTVTSLLERQALQEQRHERKVRMLESEIERMQTRYSSRSSMRRDSGFRDVNLLQCKATELRRKAQAIEEERKQNEGVLRKLEESLESAREERDDLRRWLEQHGSSSSEFMDDEDPLHGGSDAHSIVDADREARRANHSLIQQISEQLKMNEEVRKGLVEAVAQSKEQGKNLTGQISEINSNVRLVERAIKQAQQPGQEWAEYSYDEYKELLRQTNSERLRRRSARGVATRYSRDRGRRNSTDTSRSDSGRPIALLSPASPSLNQFSHSLTPSSDSEIAQLQARVCELEQALHDADIEMKIVVNKMNMAQIEVVELQADREHALRQLRKYQDHQ
ncbi:hypothetical protein KEM54_006182 [Ascosphaera aggregata]|nr:hypothetical protein KEM54_006182 [Ascosphaera aggregata]